MNFKLAFASLALATFGWTAETAVSLEDRPAIGQPAPEIKAKTWLNHIGADPSLASLRGQAVLIEFWATW